MKHFLFYLLAFILATNICTAQNDGLIVGNKKVKKEKKSKMGIGLDLGITNYKLENYSCDPGFCGEIKFIYTAPFSKRQEARWHGEINFGIEFYTGSAIKENNKKATATSSNILFAEIFNISFKPKYILNRYSSRGHWFLYPGVIFCPLIAGVPTVETKTTTINGTRKKSEYLGTATGLSFGGTIGLGYQTKHFGISIGGVAKLTAAYKEMSPTTPTVFGGQVALTYLF